MSSSKPNSDIQFFYENTSYLKNQSEGIRVSPLIKDKPLVGTIKGVKTAYDIFKNTLTRQPRDKFVGWHDSPSEPYKWLTYEEVNTNLEACGSGLLHFEGLVKSPKCVGLYATNCPEWLITELSCWAYGLVVVPLYDTLGQEAMRYICNEAELSVIVCDTPQRAKNLIDMKTSAPYLKHIVVISCKGELENLRTSAGSDIEVVTFDELLAKGNSDRQEPCPLDEDGLIVICYTSGTTGIPKGAMICNKNLVAVIAATQTVLGEFISKDDTILSFLPLAHIYEQYCEVYLMYVGARIGFYSGSISTIKEDMRALRPTIFTTVPRLLCRIYDTIYESVSKSTFKQFLLRYALKERCHKVDRQIYKNKGIWDFMIFSKIRRNFGGRIRLVLVTGAPITPSVLRFSRATFSCPVLEGYGCTETCGPMSASLAGDLSGSHVGAPWPSGEIKLADLPDMDLVAARDNKGEICVRGLACISGYYKNPEMTAKLIDEDGWLHTGDIGAWQDGRLSVIDRCKHIFKLAQGEYIAPEKLELVYVQSALINQIFIDGDAHSTFPVALVIPEAEPLLKALSKPSLESSIETSSVTQSKSSLEDICADPRSKKIIMAEMRRLSEAANLMGFEKVKNIKLITEPFTTENLMLTPTQKIARLAVRKRYSEELANLYKDHPVD